jgi:hypothetical protein
MLGLDVVLLVFRALNGNMADFLGAIDVDDFRAPSLAYRSLISAGNR